MFGDPRLPAHFWSKIVVSGKHWLWIAGKNAKGYGVFNVEGRQWKAHRFAYETLVSVIPHGLEPDHLCEYRHCVNPVCLEPVTHRENLLRGKTMPAMRAAITHCPQGHEYTDDNTYRYKGMRYCRACNKIDCKRRYQRRKEKRNANIFG